MKVILTEFTCTIEREPKDPLPRKGGWGTAESQLYYWIKKNLQAQGFDVVKRRIQSDGHIYGDEKLPYIRERKWAFYIYDEQYAVRDIVAEYKANGKVYLMVDKKQ